MLPMHKFTLPKACYRTMGVAYVHQVRHLTCHCIVPSHAKCTSFLSFYQHFSCSIVPAPYLRHIYNSKITTNERTFFYKTQSRNVLGSQPLVFLLGLEEFGSSIRLPLLTSLLRPTELDSQEKELDSPLLLGALLISPPCSGQQTHDEVLLA